MVKSFGHINKDEGNKWFTVGIRILIAQILDSSDHQTAYLKVDFDFKKKFIVPFIVA